MGSAVTLAEMAKEMEDKCREEFKHISMKDNMVVYTIGVGLTVVATCINVDCTICDRKNGKTFKELLEIDKKHN